MKSKIDIVLPKRISVLRDKKEQDLLTDKEEYSIYYQNIIYPYSDDYDIQIDCNVGKNLGHCWRIDSFDGTEGSYDFTVKIYGNYGKLLASKSCILEIYEKKAQNNATLLCIGDSMTQAETYISHAVKKIRGMKTVGLRSINGVVNHEGRGGWKCRDYFDTYEDAGWSVSPFLFPIGYAGKEYFGSKKFWNAVAMPDSSDQYARMGTSAQYIDDGMICLDNGALWRYQNGSYAEVEKEPKFEFSFAKYMERYGLDKPNIVSLLFGANEFQFCPYEQADELIEMYLDSLRKMTASIKSFDSSVCVIINLPVCGGDAYSWGVKLGCGSSVKQYNYCIKMASKAVLDEFDNRRDEGIYVCPMIAFCDTVSGFPWGHFKANIYSDRDEIHCTNWVHPSDAGYKQMGDALAGVISAAIYDKNVR